MQWNKCLLRFNVFIIGLFLATSAMGCLGEERCGPLQRQEGARCVPLVDLGLAPDQGGGDASQITTDSSLSCNFSPTLEQLVGDFGQQGKVASGTCTGTLPKPDDSFQADLSFALEGQSLVASFNYLNNKLPGKATIEPNKQVKVTAQGSLLTFTISVVDHFCFSDADQAKGTAKVSISTATGPLCEFEVEGTLKRK